MSALKPSGSSTETEPSLVASIQSSVMTVPRRMRRTIAPSPERARNTDGRTGDAQAAVRRPRLDAPGHLVELNGAVAAFGQ